MYVYSTRRAATKFSIILKLGEIESHALPTTAYLVDLRGNRSEHTVQLLVPVPVRQLGKRKKNRWGVDTPTAGRTHESAQKRQAHKVNPVGRPRTKQQKTLRHIKPPDPDRGGGCRGWHGKRARSMVVHPDKTAVSRYKTTAHL